MSLFVQLLGGLKGSYFFPFAISSFSYSLREISPHCLLECRAVIQCAHFCQNTFFEDPSVLNHFLNVYGGIVNSFYTQLSTLYTYVACLRFLQQEDAEENALTLDNLSMCE